MIKFGQWIFEKDGRLLVALIIVYLLALGALGGIIWGVIDGLVWVFSHFL